MGDPRTTTIGSAYNQVDLIPRSTIKILLGWCPDMKLHACENSVSLNLAFSGSMVKIVLNYVMRLVFLARTDFFVKRCR